MDVLTIWSESGPVSLWALSTVRVHLAGVFSPRCLVQGRPRVPGSVVEGMNSWVMGGR